MFHGGRARPQLGLIFTREQKEKNHETFKIAFQKAYYTELFRYFSMNTLKQYELYQKF